MSEGTTKPNGSGKMDIEEIEDVNRRIKDAGYKIVVNALEARFLQEKVQESDNNTGSSDSGKPTKAGDHTIIPNTATIEFEPLVPFIATGNKGKLNKSKRKKIDGKSSREEQRKDKDKDRDRT